MKPTDDEARDQALAAALSALPRTMEPGEGYVERVMDELRTEGIVRSEGPSRARRLLHAATWFLAGVGTGAAALAALRPDAAAAPLIATSNVTNQAQPAEPVEWY